MEAVAYQSNRSMHDILDVTFVQFSSSCQHSRAPVGYAGSHAPCQGHSEALTRVAASTVSGGLLTRVASLTCTHGDKFLLLFGVLMRYITTVHRYSSNYPCCTFPSAHCSC